MTTVQERQSFFDKIVGSLLGRLVLAAVTVAVLVTPFVASVGG